MQKEKDFLKMMQANRELFGDEITHITGADDSWLIQYFEQKLAKLFPLYSFMKSKYFQATFDGQGNVKEEHLVDGGFGLSVKQCVEISNFVAGRYHIDRYLHRPKFDELTAAIVLNYIEHDYPLDATQYEIVYKPRTRAGFREVAKAVDGVVGNFYNELASDVEMVAQGK